MDRTDEELILDYKQGEKAAMETIFMRYQRPILNFALRFMGNRADAEDVASEVFIGLLQNKEAYAPRIGAKFSTWLYTVARNSCLSKIRKRRDTVDPSE